MLPTYQNKIPILPKLNTMKNMFRLLPYSIGYDDFNCNVWDSMRAERAGTDFVNSTYLEMKDWNILLCLLNKQMEEGVLNHREQTDPYFKLSSDSDLIKRIFYTGSNFSQVLKSL